MRLNFNTLIRLAVFVLGLAEMPSSAAVTIARLDPKISIPPNSSTSIALESLGLSKYANYIINCEVSTPDFLTDLSSDSLAYIATNKQLWEKSKMPLPKGWSSDIPKISSGYHTCYEPVANVLAVANNENPIKILLNKPHDEGLVIENLDAKKNR